MSIWQISEYTLAVSVVALLLLGMKRLFHDKLDARWHYFIWAVLFVRMAVPLEIEWLKTPLSLFEAVPVNFWSRMMELKADRTGVTALVEGLLPWYLGGAVLLLLYYLAIALAVRVQALHLKPANEEVRARVVQIAESYGLKSCKKIRINPKGNAYVCGLFWPVLVLPAEEVSEEVILHELLHKKNKDVLINYGLHLMRVVQWFNPIIWYVTAVILNDSEALCDQRVLELMRKKAEYQPRQEEPIEKVYGKLLIHMAEKKGSRNAKVGTTNMANSYRSMRTRIGRIADFKRVPEEIGFIALCITLILSVSGISNSEPGKIVSSGVVTEQDLERVILRALTYKAETKEEALYLYLKAMDGMNPIYLLPVMPADELEAYEAWIYQMFREEKFIQWHEDGRVYTGRSAKSTQLGIPEWIVLGEEGMDNPWFVKEGLYIQDCRLYNLNTEDTSLKGERVMAQFQSLQKGVNADKYFGWELELLYEDGWKVRRIGEKTYDDPNDQNPEPLIGTAITQGDWKLEARGWNEGYFPDLFSRSTGFTYHWGEVKDSLEREKEAEYPTEFPMTYKHVRVEATYLGKEPPKAKEVTIESRIYTKEEWAELMESGDLPTTEGLNFLARHEGMGLLGRPEYEGTNFTSSNGQSRDTMLAEQVKSGEPMLLNGYGSGYQHWSREDELHMVVSIYYDEECVEVIYK